MCVWVRVSVCLCVCSYLCAWSPLHLAAILPVGVCVYSVLSAVDLLRSERVRQWTVGIFRNTWPNIWCSDDSLSRIRVGKGDNSLYCIISHLISLAPLIKQTLIQKHFGFLFHLLPLRYVSTRARPALTNTESLDVHTGFVCTGVSTHQDTPITGGANAGVMTEACTSHLDCSWLQRRSVLSSNGFKTTFSSTQYWLEDIYSREMPTQLATQQLVRVQATPGWRRLC